MMTYAIRKQLLRGALLMITLALVSIYPSDFWLRPAFGEKEKTIMLAPQGQGSAWDLPAGSYDDSGQDDTGAYQGESPIPGGGGSNSNQGGSPIPGSGYGDLDQGGSPRAAGGGSGSDLGGSPLPAN